MDKIDGHSAKVKENFLSLRSVLKKTKGFCKTVINGNYLLSNKCEAESIIRRSGYEN
jgi:hypothetical protein